jgi:hypothetical protein
MMESAAAIIAVAARSWTTFIGDPYDHGRCA